jgi:hypothetical protein
MRSAVPSEGGHKSYLLPVVEIAAMNAALYFAGRQILEPAHFKVTPAKPRRPRARPDDQRIAGSFLGEPLFRISPMLLDRRARQGARAARRHRSLEE